MATMSAAPPPKAFQRKEDKALRIQEETDKEEARSDEQPPLQKALNYLELAGMLFLVSKFKKPLSKVAKKIFQDIESEAIKVTDAVKDAIEKAELELRNLIIADYMLDPIQAHRIGPELYHQLVEKGNWDTNILTDLDATPSTMDKTFVIGTGPGAITVTSDLSRALSVHILIICESLIQNSKKLKK